MHLHSTLLDPSFEPLVRRETEPPYCIVWTGTRVRSGYGLYRGRRAHRVAYELAYGPIPPGLEVMHRCDNRPCVRPEHLWAGTHADNMRDKVAKGRAGKGRKARPGASDEEWSARQWRKRSRIHGVLIDQALAPAPITPEKALFDS